MVGTQGIARMLCDPDDPTYDARWIAVAELTERLFPLFETRFRERLVAVYAKPLPPERFTAQQARELLELEWLLTETEAGGGRHECLERALSQPGGSLRAAMGEAEAAELETRVEAMRQKMRTRPPPSDDVIFCDLVNHASHVVGRWVDALLDAAGQTATILVDAEMVPVAVTGHAPLNHDSWLRSPHPSLAPGPFVIEAAEMREVLRDFKAAHALGRPLPPPALAFLQSRGIVVTEVAPIP